MEPQSAADRLRGTVPTTTAEAASEARRGCESAGGLDDPIDKALQSLAVVRRVAASDQIPADVKAILSSHVAIAIGFILSLKQRAS